MLSFLFATQLQFRQKNNAGQQKNQCAFVSLINIGTGQMEHRIPPRLVPLMRDRQCCNVTCHYMDILQKKVNNSRILWTLTSIIIFIGFFFALIGFAEFFNVAVAGEVRRYQYPWGLTNEVPWYYRNSTIYSSYNLISGLLFFIVTTLTLCARIQKRKTIAIIGVSFILLLVFAELISSSIQ